MRIDRLPSSKVPPLFEPIQAHHLGLAAFVHLVLCAVMVVRQPAPRRAKAIRWLLVPLVFPATFGTVAVAFSAAKTSGAELDAWGVAVGWPLMFAINLGAGRHLAGLDTTPPTHRQVALCAMGSAMMSLAHGALLGTLAFVLANPDPQVALLTVQWTLLCFTPGYLAFVLAGGAAAWVVSHLLRRVIAAW